MCTAITLTTKDHYFGRNLDLEYSYQETVTITPRNYPFYFRKSFSLPAHHAIIGMAYVCDDYPLYYDAMNEMGLSMAGLHFPGNAVYLPYQKDKDNITPFEFIPWILGQCSTIAEAKKLLERTNLLDENFSKDLPLSPLHWILSDRESSIVLEPMETGLRIYDNPAGILTNNPTFDRQMENASSDTTHLPGDWSSPSRFQKAVYMASHSVCGPSEQESVNQFFHLLDAVAVPRGCKKAKDSRYEITVYSSCCNMNKGIYYYKTYENSQITGIDLFLENLEENRLISYPLLKENKIIYCNFFSS